ncbi:MAG: hypothetical protein M3141_02890, partial [Actinomycetota bacterium]|nr:hypothetical protein [Actinomycetota bacterium]
MIQDQPSFELERFELIPATPVHVLLRVWGRWSVPEGSHAAPRLLATEGTRQHRFEALNPSEAAIVAGEWSAAYAAPVALLEHPETTFSLDGPDGEVPLPPPTEASPSESRLQERRTTPDRRRAEPEDAPVGGDRRGIRDRRRQRSAAELRAFRAEVSRLEARVEDLAERAEAAEARAAAQVERVHKLEAALAERVGHIYALEARAAEAEEKFEPLDEELSETRERLGDTESTLADAARQRQALEAELADATEARRAIEAQLAKATGERHALEARLAEADARAEAAEAKIADATERAERLESG